MILAYFCRTPGGARALFDRFLRTACLRLHACAYFCGILYCSTITPGQSLGSGKSEVAVRVMLNAVIRVLYSVLRRLDLATWEEVR